MHIAIAVTNNLVGGFCACLAGIGGGYGKHRGAAVWGVDRKDTEELLDTNATSEKEPNDQESTYRFGMNNGLLSILCSFVCECNCLGPPCT